LTTTLCICPLPKPRAPGVEGTTCENCGGEVVAKKRDEVQPNCAKITDADLNVALLEIDRMERELKTMAGRLSTVKASLKSKLTSQV
jgi:hypothetical protein